MGREDSGHLDYLGQILEQMNHDVTGKRLPSDLKKVIFPFTCMQRGRVLDTNITLQIVSLDGLSPADREKKVISILKEIGITLEFI